MTATVDELLAGLRDVESDPRLKGIDAAVMAGVAAYREKAVARRGLLLTSVLALGVGLGTSVLPAERAQAEHVVSFNAAPSSAPSNLLMGMR